MKKSIWVKRFSTKFKTGEILREKSKGFGCIHHHVCHMVQAGNSTLSDHVLKQSFATVLRDFWTDKFLYDALVPVLVILIITSAIVLTGVGILRQVNENLSLILSVCSFGTHVIIWKIFNLKDFSWIQLQFGKRRIILLRYVGRLQKHFYLNSGVKISADYFKTTLLKTSY